MKIKTQLTLAALMVMGMFATGCSQQSADASASPAQQTAQATGSQQTSQQATQESGATETTGTETTTTEVVETVEPQVKTIIKYDCSKCDTRPVVRPHVQRPYVRPAQPRPVRPYVRPAPMPMPEVVVPSVKAKGNYKGPVMLTPATREAIMQMQAE